MVATFDVVISRSFYYLALKLLDVSIFSICLTLSPVAAIVWSLLFFDSYLSGKQLLGIVIVLSGIFSGHDKNTVKKTKTN